MKILTEYVIQEYDPNFPHEGWTGDTHYDNFEQASRMLTDLRVAWPALQWRLVKIVWDVIDD